MQDKLGPISDLVAELKKKKPMTQSEEIDLLQTLEFFSRDMDSGEMNIFVNGVRDQLEESISNKGVEKGIDLSEIKKAATRTKARIKDDKRVIEENNRKIDSKSENKTSNEHKSFLKSDYAITAEFEAAMDKYIERSFSNLPPAARKAMKERIKNGKQLKDEFTQECEQCKKDGRKPPLAREFLEKISAKKNVPIESLELDSVLEIGTQVEYANPQNLDEFLGVISENPILEGIYPENVGAIKSIIGTSGGDLTVEEAYSKMQTVVGKSGTEIRGKGKSWTDFYNDFFVVPTLERNIKKGMLKSEEIFNDTIDHYSDVEDTHLSSMIVKQRRNERRVNINRMALAAITGKENPIISEELRKAIIEEYMNGDQPVAIIFEKFRKEGRLQDTNTTAYDFIDVVASELEKKNLSNESCGKFIANEEQIADELYTIEAREIIKEKTEASWMLAAEHDENSSEIETLHSNIKIRNQYSARFRDILKNKQNVQENVARRNIVGISLKRFLQKKKFEDIALYSTINTKDGIKFEDELTEKKSGIKNIFSVLRKRKVTTREANDEKQDIAPLANNQGRNVTNQKKISNTTLQVEEIHTGDQQEASLDDGGRE